MSPKTTPLVLIVLDGWGLSKIRDCNAIALANTPTYLELLERYPHASLITNGEAVGLPTGQMGNSEVGHMNLGAGRIIYQDLTRIDQSISSGEFFKNPRLLESITRCTGDRQALHLIGLVSDGGVHSHQHHLNALIKMAAKHRLDRVFVQVITDGRDTSPTAGANFIAELEQTMTSTGVGKIASVTGRYYAMDRDRRWERTRRTYEMLTKGTGKSCKNAQKLINEAYSAGITDEFIEPSIVLDETGNPIGNLEDGDSVVFFNFRSDRARQLTRAITFDDFNDFNRSVFPRIHSTTMTEYDATYHLPTVFPPEVFSSNLATVLANHGIRNLRLAETEKYAHVTYFFNCGEEKPYQGEERILIPSPKVPTYDLQPEMSATEITKQLVTDVKNSRHDLIICNFANADMVGHTGKLDATISAISTLDHCLLQIVQTVENIGGTVIITSDHGNAEQMWNSKRGEPHTAHTTNPVPILVVEERLRDSGYELSDGSLCDVASTILGILKIAQPTQMTGSDLRAWRDS